MPAAQLHRFLGIGLVIFAGALIIMRQSGAAAGSGPGSLLPAYAIAAASFLMCSAALILLKPLVPRREAGRTLETYWSDPAVTSKALLVWFILEGAGVMASVSYFLGGGPISLALIVLTVAIYWLNGPRVLAGE